MKAGINGFGCEVRIFTEDVLCPSPRRQKA
jgi:hypothetical protein